MPPRPATARRAPSGLNATDAMLLGPVVGPRSGSPVVGFRSLTPLLPPAASSAPSGLNATDATDPSLPVRGQSRSPVDASQMRAVPSVPPLAIRLPSRVNATV